MTSDKRDVLFYVNVDFYGTNIDSKIRLTVSFRVRLNIFMVQKIKLTLLKTPLKNITPKVERIPPNLRATCPFSEVFN